MVISSIQFKKYLYLSALGAYTAYGVTCLNYTWFQVAFLLQNATCMVSMENESVLLGLCSQTNCITGITTCQIIVIFSSTNTY